LDKATIEAMRKVAGLMVRRSENLARNNLRTASIGNEVVSLEEHRLAADGFRELVDQAEAEQAEPDQDAGDDGVKMVHRVVEYLDGAASSAGRVGGDVRIAGGGFSGFMWPKNAAVAARAINGLLNAKPTTPAEPPAEPNRLTSQLREVKNRLSQDMKFDDSAKIRDAIAIISKMTIDDAPEENAEPTLEECVAAMNQSEYLNASDWTLAVASQDIDVIIDVGAFKIAAAWLIDRERAAKGGA
jgi:hypothetical protein